MSLEVTGRLHTKFPTQQIKDTFSKREFILELVDESPTGMVFTNYASFQLVNNSCALIDQYQEGEVLKVSFNVKGAKWERDGQVKYITNLNAWRIEKAGQQPTQQQEVAQYTPPQQAQGYTSPSQNNSSIEGLNNPNVDDNTLPF